MSPDDFHLPAAGPELRVWDHIQAGLESARTELDRLAPGERSLVEVTAEILVSVRERIVASPATERILGLEQSLLNDPWFRYAADIRLGEELARRASEAFQRYLDLQPVVSTYTLSPEARRYIREASQTFVFGFDAACIALCGATLETVLKEVLIDRRFVTRQQLKREGATAFRVLELAKRENVLDRLTIEVARRVCEERNSVMHSGVTEDEQLKKSALGSIGGLAAVLHALGRDSEGAR